MNMFEMAAAQKAERKASLYNYRFRFPSFDQPIGLLKTPAQPDEPPIALTSPLSVQPAQSETQADDLIREAVGLALQAYLKAREPKWLKRSPGSLLIYKLCDQVAASPSLTPEARGVLNLIKFGAFLYGLGESDN